MLALPDRPTDRIALADWLELSALTSRRKYSSAGDLERALQRAAIYRDGANAIEAKLADVTAELEARVVSAKDGYPFVLVNGVLTLRDDPWRSSSAYLFCLCLTTLGNRPDGKGTYPERIFEGLCAYAARNFLGGQSIRFGSPRDSTEIDRAFGEAVESLCVRLGEGGGFNRRPTHWSKDWGVDVVAWRPLPDALPGQLVLFGGCASGKDWDQKLSECNPTSWCSAWMRETPASQVLRAFFLPRRIDIAEWLLKSYQAGLIFDRCRIANWAATLPSSPRYGNGERWAKLNLKKLATQN